MNIDPASTDEMTAYRRGVKRPQFLAGVFRFLGLLVVILSIIGIVVGVLAAANDGEVSIALALTSLVSGLFLLAISALLDWCAILLLTLRYGTNDSD